MHNMNHIHDHNYRTMVERLNDQNLINRVLDDHAIQEWMNEWIASSAQHNIIAVISNCVNNGSIPIPMDIINFSQNACIVPMWNVTAENARLIHTGQTDNLTCATVMSGVDRSVISFMNFLSDLLSDEINKLVDNPNSIYQVMQDFLIIVSLADQTYEQGYEGSLSRIFKSFNPDATFRGEKILKDLVPSFLKYTVLKYTVLTHFKKYIFI